MSHYKNLNQIIPVPVDRKWSEEPHGVRYTYQTDTDQRGQSRYKKTGKKAKGTILDEFCQNTGYGRQYAIHLLTTWNTTHWVTVDGKLVRLKTGASKKTKQKNQQTPVRSGSHHCGPPYLGGIRLLMRQAPGPSDPPYD
jgi:hypothetical protein